MALVTVEDLARLKQLNAEDLRAFGLADAAYGVRFDYRGLAGETARARRRTGLRGAGGSSWDPDGGLPIVPYIHADHRARVAAAGYLIVVEGESDCWAGWTHGVPVLGVPGSDQWSTLTAGHLAGARTVFLQREPIEAPNATFPQGIEVYLATLERHVRNLGFAGEVFELQMPEGLEDLSALHCADPARFAQRLEVGLAQARRSPRPSTGLLAAGDEGRQA
jgi:hypothetical protein